ncbi:hypothetical protein D3C79_746640 [compost metagenome]
MLVLKHTQPPAQAVAVTRHEVLQPLGARRQPRVLACHLAARCQAPQLGADHPPRTVDHQAPGRRLRQRPHTGTQAGRLQVAVQHRAALAFADRTMAARRRCLCTAIGWHQFVARVVQEGTIGWV